VQLSLPSEADGSPFGQRFYPLQYPKILYRESHRCTVHFAKLLQQLTNKCIYITFTQNTLKHLKPLQHASIFSDHHQGVPSFLAKVITYYDLVRFCKQGVVAAYHVV